MHALPSRDPGSISSWLLAIAVHVALFSVLFFGIRWKTKPAEPVMAELWSQLPSVVEPRVEPRVEPPPRVEPKPAPPKPEPKPEPRVEPKPAPKPDIALEQEKKKKEEAEKKKREEELRAKEEKEKELRAREEKERREKELAEKRRAEEESRKRMQAELNRELAAAPKAATAPPVAGDPAALATWQNQIQARIRSNIILPPDLAGNPQAEFDVALLPTTGEVLSVRLARSSGNRALDDAWERAILKSSPLPRPSKPEIFVRDLRLKFRPSE